MVALRDWSANVMVGVSLPWVDADQDRGILEVQTLLVGPLEYLTRVHDKLVVVTKKAGEVEAETAILTQKLGALDAHHDRKARGVEGVLSGAVELADDPERAQELDASYFVR